MQVLHSQPIAPLVDIKVLIVEEQEVIRHGLLAITSSIPEVASPAEAVATVPALDESTDVDVTLISMSTLVSAECKGLSADHLQPMIVIVPSAAPDQLEIATRRPASGYILQAELTPSSLRTALLRVLGGELAVSGKVAAHLLSRVRGDEARAVAPPAHLSSRESEVLTLLVAGASNKAIANELRISVHAVKRHVSNLLSRFNSPNRVHLVSLILRSGIVPVSGAGPRGARPADD